MAVNQSVLEILIRAKDEASKSLESINGWANKNQAAFKGMAAVGGAAFAGLTAVLFTAAKAAADAEQGVAQLEAVLKSTGDAVGITSQEIRDHASALSLLSTFEDDAILGAQNLLLTFTQIKGPVFKEATQAVLDMSVALGQDLKTSSIQVGKALNDPINGVNALRKVGVSLTESQANLIKKMVEMGDVAGAQRVILKELGTEFGGSALAQAKTFGGQLAILKNQLGEVGEALGGPLLDSLSGLIGIVRPIVDKMVEWTNANPALAAALAVSATAAAGLLAIFGIVGVALPALTAAFEFLGPAVFVVGAALSALLGAFAGFAAIDGAKSSLDGLFLLIEEKTGLISFFKNVWQEMTILFQGIVIPVARDVWDMFNRHRELFEWLAKVIGTFLVLAIKTLVMALEVILVTGAGVVAVFTEIATVLTDVVLIAVEAVVATVNALIDAFKSAWEWGKKVTGMGDDGGSSDKKKALGGTVMSGQSYTVGENGPERFTPGTSGFISPAFQGTGGQSVQVVINGGIFAQDPHEMAEYLGDLMVERFQFGGAKL